MANISLKKAKKGDNKIPDIGALKGIFNQFGGGDDQKLNKGEEIKQQSQAYNFNPNNVAPPEVKKQLGEILKWHDDVMREITKKIEMVPGLSNLLEEFSNSLNECLYSFLSYLLLLMECSRHIHCYCTIYWSEFSFWIMGNTF